jgi:ElaB/YqjD/DUF883 family membrane-anchored ribosome-binding protein
MKEFHDSFEDNPDRQGYGNSLSNRQPATFDKVKSSISHKLEDAARSLREKSQGYAGNNQQLAGYGNQAAEWLTRSANYVEEINPQQLKTDVENQVRHNPGRSLLIAAGVGLALGALLRRR